MLIGGLQKTTLLDYPGKVAAMVFTYGCNMRCPYCHNPELVINPISALESVEEIAVLSFLKSRSQLIDGLVITGGEPTIHKDLPSFMKKVKDLGLLIKLDTNGSNPKMLKIILKEHLVDYFAMDIKYEEELYKQNIEPSIKYEDILESVQIIMNSGIDYEFRTTYMKGLHTLESAKGIGEIIQGSKRYYIQNFRPGKTINPELDNSNSFTRKELKDFKKVISKYVSKVCIRG